MAYKLIYNPLIDYIRSHVCLCVILLYSKASCLCTVEWYTVACKPNLYVYVTGFGKTDHMVTIDISRNTDLKYRSHHAYQEVSLKNGNSGAAAGKEERAIET